MRRLVLGAAATWLLFAAPALAEPNKQVCPGPAHNGAARCHAHVVTDDKGKPLAKSQPQAALAPADLRSAYGLTTLSTTGGAGRTIAIVDAYHYPTAEADLATYRSKYGLSACTKASGCFSQVSQTGSTTSFPAVNAGWAQEAALDLDMASAICPNCNLILVEANSSYLTDLGAAVNEGAALGANVISNSYGGGEYSSETADELAYYNHPDIAITVSSGDSGYGAEFPAASRYVTAVGGTSLRKATNARGWTETAWSGAGSGCSRYVTKQAWQPNIGCASARTIADVSAVADPATGVSVYDSTPYQGSAGWLKFGGTSVAAPLIGGVYALGTTTGVPASIAYANTGSLFDVISGSNGRCSRSTPAVCNARSGYDGPTGLGTPNGITAF